MKSGRSPRTKQLAPRPVSIEPALEHEQRPKLLSMVAPSGLVLVDHRLHVDRVDEALPAQAVGTDNGLEGGCALSMRR